MKLTSTLAGTFWLLGNISAALAQGSLTPPGAPAPTMKTLDQIEPRKPISSVPFAIASSGSYYLTTNLTGTAGNNGLEIYANDVTVDLNGFTLTGLPSGAAGVYFTGAYTNVSVRNGTLRGWPSGGVEASSSRHCRFSNLNIVRCTFGSFNAGSVAVVENCSVFDSGGGIYVFDGSWVADCQSISNANNGIGGPYKGVMVERCIVRNNSGNGIIVGPNGRVKDCVVENNSGDGISTGNGSLVEACTVFGNGSLGIDLGRFSRVMNCTSVSNASGAINLANGSAAQNCLGAYGGYGFNLADGCVVQDCSALGNVNDGITLAVGSSTVINCQSRSNTYGVNLSGPGVVSGTVAEFNKNAGILVGNYSVITGNTIRSNGFSLALGGIFVSGRGNRIEGNTCNGNLGSGIIANGSTSTNNLFIRNAATANSAGNFNFNVTNHFVNASGFNLATNTNPHANFSY